MELYNGNNSNLSAVHDSVPANRYEESFVFMDDAEYEFFEERAAIMEYDGRLTREKAEQLAYQKILRNRKIYAQAS